MSACEKCWDQAFVDSRTLGGSQVEHYQRLIDGPDHQEESYDSDCTDECPDDCMADHKGEL